MDLVGLKPNPWTSSFLPCFDTVGWVIWPVKTHPQYDLYNVFRGMLNLTQQLAILSSCHWIVSMADLSCQWNVLSVNWFVSKTSSKRLGTIRLVFCENIRASPFWYLSFIPVISACLTEDKNIIQIVRAYDDMKCFFVQVDLVRSWLHEQYFIHLCCITSWWSVLLVVTGSTRLMTPLFLVHYHCDRSPTR